MNSHDIYMTDTRMLKETSREILKSCGVSKGMAVNALPTLTISLITYLIEADLIAVRLS